MGIFNRMSNMVRAKVNSTLDDMENPIELLDQKIKDMEEQLSNAKINSAKVIGNAKALEKKVRDCEAEVADYDSKVKLALSKGNEDLAKKALARKLDSEKKLATLQGTYTNARTQADALKNNLLALQEVFPKNFQFLGE